MKFLAAILLLPAVLVIAAQTTLKKPPMMATNPELAVKTSAGPLVLKASTVWLPIERTAVDLQIVTMPDDTHLYFVLWTDGSITSNINGRTYWPPFRFEPPIPPPLNPCPADLDGDGKVTVADLLIFNAAFGTTCP